MAKRKRKIVKIKKARGFNIGVIIFLIILIYIGVNVVLYMTRDTISVYEVVKGSTVSATNHSYTGLILRDEKVGEASNSGYVSFYVKEGTKVSPISSLYSIDETGTVLEMLKKSAETESTLSNENLSAIKAEICSFVGRYDEMKFESVYDFKYDLESELLEYVNLNALQSLTQSSEEGVKGVVFKVFKPKQSGIVEYYIDGMEDMKESQIKKELFEDGNYSKKVYKTSDLVEQNAAIYKVIPSEDWNIYIPLSSEEATYYADTDVVKIKFMKDNLQCNAEFDIINNSGEIFGKLTLNRYMVRYADSRFIDIQIINNEISGLKIPKTSVVEKEFYTVPVEYYTKGGDGAQGFSKKVVNEQGEESTEFITPTIYQKDDKFCYLSVDEVEENTWLILPGDTTGQLYGVKATAPLKGVYNVNLGYCVFEKINILAESGNYYIIEAGTEGGVAIYDHIVLDSDTAKDHTLINK